MSVPTELWGWQRGVQLSLCCLQGPGGADGQPTAQTLSCRSLLLGALSGPPSHSLGARWVLQAVQSWAGADAQSTLSSRQSPLPSFCSPRHRSAAPGSPQVLRSVPGGCHRASHTFQVVTRNTSVLRFLSVTHIGRLHDIINRTHSANIQEEINSFKGA